MCCSSSSAPPRSSNDGKNVEEDVDDVQVQVKSTKDVFLWTQGQFLVAKQQLRIHGQETGEEQSPQSSVHNVQNPIADDDAEDAYEDQDN